MTSNHTGASRQAVLDYAGEHYGTEPEYLWRRYPNYAVLRHSENRKWFAVLMDVKGENLGLEGAGKVDLMDVKCDPLMIGSLLTQPGILPAYHMKKGSWITVLLDGTVSCELMQFLLDMSYDETLGKK